MKNALLPFALILSVCAIAQPYQHEKLTYYDNDGKPTKEKKAVMLQQLIQLSDTLWETNIYRMNGSRIVSIQSTTADGMSRNGAYITYHPDGWSDTLGHYEQGKRNGNWFVYAGKYFVGQLHYDQDQLMWKKDTLELNRERDSIKAAKTKDGQILIEIESEFPGGLRAWGQYLNQNLRYPDDAINKTLMGQVTIGFLIDGQGVVPPTSIWVRQSVAYPLDKESLRVIYLSGNWRPAVQFGKNVKSYKFQPVIFRLERR